MPQRLRSVIVGLVGLTVGVTLGLLQFNSDEDEAAVDGPAVAPLSSGAELIFVYIGASTCGWSNVPELPGLMEQAKEAVWSAAEETGANFGSVGISRDRIVDRGLDHLKKYGRFDEISTGRGWVNMGMLKYVYGTMPGRAATPQLLVVSRVLSREGGQTNVLNERVVVRKVGFDDMRDWVEAGTPLPSLP